MALARTRAVALIGMDGQLVEIEADLSAGLPGMSITGLADTAVMESRDRIRSAIANSGADWPNRRITVALLPADVRKAGSRFDLALAVAVLAASEQIAGSAIGDVVWIAELGLDGRLRPVRGVLPAVVAARAAGVPRVVVPRANAAEAALVGGIDVRTADSLAEVVGSLRGELPPLDIATPPGEHEPSAFGVDLADVAGQTLPKRALEIAAAGRHHLYLVGPPGAGKTMLAERLPTVLPPLDDRTAIEVTAVHSVAGRLPRTPRLIRRAPFEAPHHTATVAALVGGGSQIARPGSISLAHAGVLFLDEAPEFSAGALDAMRQPIESGTVTLHRSGGAVTYPARFQLVLAANPCPCGRSASDCECVANVRRRYLQKLSGPLLDRVDLRVKVDPVQHVELFADGARETSADVAARVAAARAAAAQRWQALPWECNGEVPGPVLRSGRWALPRAALQQLQHHVDRGSISARGYDRVLRLAWTLADLGGRETPGSGELAEALYFRIGDGSAVAA